MRRSIFVNVLTVLFLSAALISACGTKEDDKEDGKKTTVATKSIAMGGICAVDTINSVAAVAVNAVKKSTNLAIGGWAADDRNGSVPPEVSIELVSADGKERVTGAASRGTKRPDVAKAFNTPVFEGAGFDGVVSIEKAASGRYSIWIVQMSNGVSLSCDSKRIVEIQ